MLFIINSYFSSMKKSNFRQKSAMDTFFTVCTKDFLSFVDGVEKGGKTLHRLLTKSQTFLPLVFHDFWCTCCCS